ncbi:MAG: PAS domain S-box protein [Methanospirillum sp.]|nr:PAS domain S-box protein [Methanospirillum sp.]
MTRLDAELARIREILRDQLQGMSVTEIAAALGRNKHSVGRYLDVLRASGQVEMRTFGMAKVFTLAKRLPVASMLSIADEPILVLDEERRVNEANDAALALLGLPRERVIGQRLDYLPAPDPLVHDLVREIALAAAGQATSTEIHLEGEDERWYWCRAIPMVFELGERGVVLVLADVTEQRRAAEALAASEALFRGLAENVQDGVLIYRGETLVFANSRATEFLGSDPGEGDLARLVAEVDRERAAALIAAHVADPLRPREFRCWVRRDGAERYLYARLSAVEDDGEVTRYLVLTDISEEHRAEMALRKQAVFVQHFLDEFPHPFYTLDAAGVFVECNDAFAAMVGRGREDVVGATVDEVVPGEDREAFVVADAGVLERPGERVYCTTLTVAGEGRTRFLVRKSSLRIGDEGRPVVVGVLIGHPDAGSNPRSAVIPGDPAADDVRDTQ